MARAKALTATETSEILKVLAQNYSEARCSLNYRNPFELLVATVLSAQCTDERVNKVTPELFLRFPDSRALAKGSLREIEGIIRSTGFFRAKAKSLKELAERIVQQHGGNVPRTMEELTKLRGVGRKTANVLLGNAFGIPGLVVDTHVGRISRLIGWVDEKDPERIEKKLQRIVPRESWIVFSHWLIKHGREICIARRPKCGICPIRFWCREGAAREK